MIAIKIALPRFRSLMTTGLAVLALLASTQSQAASQYLTTWSNTYPASQSDNTAGCQICHAASTQNLNPYGAAFCNAGGSTQQRIQAAEGADSDNDPTGTNNIGEINANAQPGWTTSAVPTFQRNNCQPTGNTETSPLNQNALLDPAPPAPDQCDFSVAPTTLNFGNVETGTTASASTTVTNNGTAACTITAAVNSASGAYTLGSAPTINVPVGGSASVAVDFAPTSTGQDDATLNLASDDANNPQSANVALTGNGVAPPPPDACNITVAPTTLAFGNVETGASATLSTTVTNTGSAACSITANVASASGEFTLATASPVSIGVGGSASVSVTYSPVNTGADSGSLNLVNADPNNTQSIGVTLSGNGVAPPPPDTCGFTATPAALDFGNVNVGSSASRSTTVTNTGTASCTITASVTGADFALTSASPLTVAVGGSATVSVSYTPSAAGTDSGNLNLTSDNAVSVDVSLTGNGVDNVPPPGGTCEGLDIDRAEYSNRRDRLRVEGDGGQRDAGDFVLRNAFDLSQVLAEGGSENDDRDFDFRVRNAEPVPCWVRVEQPGSGRCDIREVSRAPADCAPKEPPAENLPPVADANGPYSGATGEPITFDGSASFDPDGSIVAYDWDFGDGNTGSGVSPSHAYAAEGTYAVTLVVTDDDGATGSATSTATIADEPPPADGNPVARGDTYATPLAGNSGNPKRLVVRASRTSGVLYNDFDTDGAGNNIGNEGLTAVLMSEPAAGTLVSFDPDGSFVYVPGPTLVDNANDSFTYQAMDADGNLSEETTVNIHIESDQVDFKIMMNYELGMHCTGFEFSYCCVLPPYNSILAQVVKPQSDATPDSNADYPRLLEGDPNHGLDGLGRETVLRDFTEDGGFRKYYLEYYHDAQPRREGNMPGTFNDQVTTLISDIEGNSMLYHNTPYDSALVDTDGSITGVPGKLVRGNYNGIPNVVLGDGDYTGAADNYANGWLNHFYIYPNEHGNPNLEGENATGDSLEADKIRLGVNGMVVYPANVGAALQPMGPVSASPVPFDNVLTFSADTGTVVYTQMKVLENLPIMLTSPRIWEALGLPLTPFEDTINFFGEPGAVDEDTIRPFVAMKARLHEADCDGAGNCTKGAAVIGSNGQPVIGHGTAPIDIPNCERCHSVPAFQPDGVTPNVNSPSYVRGDLPIYGPAGMTLEAITNLEIEYWKSVYPSLNTGSDWYARLKGAAVNMLAMHDLDTGTNFLANYPSTGDLLGLPLDKQIPQNTRMGHESVICQKCHGDNVIAAVNPLGPDAGFFLPPISEAIHNRHRNQSEGGVIVFNDSLGRDGGCQGCHPAHRSDGTMDNYPITIAGNNANASGDNRLNQGGCFVGRDVHSNPLKDIDGAETPSHLNAVGEWLVDNVFYNQAGLGGSDADNRGIWCTNCHTQLSQEIWRHEDCDDLINGDCINDIRGLPSLGAIAAAVGLSEAEAIDYLDPQVDGFDRGVDQTHAIWDPAIPDANVATIEVGPAGPVVTFDADGDPSVNILSFCTTDDCVARINANKTDQGQWRYPANAFIDPVNSTAVAVPFEAATDGRDHWLSAGEPHCADCHAAPYVEQSGNINPFPPFNYPAKAGLMRYSRGHQDLGCQACHESTHGLYPVTPAVDTTTYAQAAALNHDGSHGPLKCGACHEVGEDGIPTWINPRLGITDYDSAVSWAHTYTAEASVLDTTCQNCHGDERDEMSPNDEDYLEHADVGRTSRLMMDMAELERFGHVLGAEPGEERRRLCSACHEQELGEVDCDGDWRRHLTRGRVSASVWEAVSLDETGTTCGW